MADTGDLIPDELSDKYKAYVCKDGRVRVYNKDSKKVTSYPRFLTEQALGRPLEKNEHVHHLDENPLNNSFSNLAIVPQSEHSRLHATKYYDKEVVCPWCGESFIWTRARQARHYSNASRVDRPTMA